MIQFEWSGDATCCSADCLDLSAWIEPLAVEGEGRFVWSVDEVDVTQDGDAMMNLLGGVEPSLTAAKCAAAEALVYLSRNR